MKAFEEAAVGVPAPVPKRTSRVGSTPALGAQVERAMLANAANRLLEAAVVVERCSGEGMIGHKVAVRQSIGSRLAHAE